MAASTPSNKKLTAERHKNNKNMEQRKRFALSSRVKVTKEIHRVITEHLHQDVPKYDIDIDILPRINFAYYGRPGNCYWGLTFSWIVWDLSLRWESKGLPPKRVRPKQSYRR